VDRARFEALLQQRIESPTGLAAFVKERGSSDFCGPTLLGENPTPIAPRVRFPAVSLSLSTAADGGPAGTVSRGSTVEVVRLAGILPLLWRSHESVDSLVITDSPDKGNGLCKAMLEPFLFFLALRAGTGAESGCTASHEWLGERPFIVHVACREGFKRFAYPADAIGRDEAGDYLGSLVAALLDRRTFDLLPFDLITQDKDLKRAYTLEGSDPLLALVRDQYDRRLQDAIEDDWERDRPIYHHMKLLEIVTTRVPPDAFDKVRQRYRVLARSQ
jgi:hypothetical protein